MLRALTSFKGLLLFSAAMVLLFLLSTNQSIDVPRETREHRIEVDGPDGVIFAGNVTVHAGTAYSILLAASDVGGFEVEATGSGDQLFVTAIDGHRNAGAAGWCYFVWDDGWVDPPVSAGVAATDGAVRWEWREAGCPGQ